MLEYYFVLCLIILCLVFRWKYRKHFKLSKALGSDLVSLPFIGIAYLVVGSGVSLMNALKIVGQSALRRKGPISVWLGHRLFVVIADPILAEQVSKDCLEKDEVMRVCMSPVLGDCNFVAPVNIWYGRRKNLAPIFSSKNLKRFVNVFTEQSKILVDQLQPTLGKSVATLDYFIKYTMESLFQTVLCCQLNTQTVHNHPFIEGLKIQFRLVGERLLKPWLFFDSVYELLPSYKLTKKVTDFDNLFVDEIIQDQKKKMQEQSDANKSEESFKSLLELLIEVSSKNNEYSDVQLREEIMGIVIAGLDTSSIATGFIAHMLATYPEVQEKVYNELVEVFGEEESLTSEHLSRLKYMDAVIKETLRLYPPVPVIVRQVMEDYELPSGAVMPQGCGILIHLWAINRNPDYWGPDADVFRPERFLDYNPKHPAQFSTFSIGPRNCVGFKYALLSMPKVFSTILRRYRIVPASPTSSRGDVDDGLQICFAITMKDVNGFPVKLQLRNP